MDEIGCHLVDLLHGLVEVGGSTVGEEGDHHLAREVIALQESADDHRWLMPPDGGTDEDRIISGYQFRRRVVSHCGTEIVVGFLLDLSLIIIGIGSIRLSCEDT